MQAFLYGNAKTHHTSVMFFCFIAVIFLFPPFLYILFCLHPRFTQRHKKALAAPTFSKTLPMTFNFLN